MACQVNCTSKPQRLEQGSSGGKRQVHPKKGVFCGQSAGSSLPGAQSAGFAGPGSYSYWGSTPNPGAARSHRTKASPAFAPRPPDGGGGARARRGKEVPQGTAQPDLVEGQAEPMGWSGSGLPLSATVLRATRSCSGPATRACAAGIGRW